MVLGGGINMKLIETNKDIVFDQGLLSAPKVFYTEDNSIKVILSNTGINKTSKFISIAYYPIKTEPVDTETCQLLLSQLDLPDVFELSGKDIGIKDSSALSPHIRRFITI